MLGCLITAYNFSIPGTKPVLCALYTNQHRLNIEGLCVPVLQSWQHLLRRLVDYMIDMNHMDCRYTLRNLNSCSKKAHERSQIHVIECIIFSQ